MTRFFHDRWRSFTHWWRIVEPLKPRHQPKKYLTQHPYFWCWRWFRFDYTQQLKGHRNPFGYWRGDTVFTIVRFNGRTIWTWSRGCSAAEHMCQEHRK